MPTNEAELLRAARAVAKHQRHIRNWRRLIKQAQAEMRLEKRHLRALVQTIQSPDVAPNRLFGGDVGVGRLHSPRDATWSSLEET
jgi:hypothetical protein